MGLIHFWALIFLFYRQDKAEIWKLGREVKDFYPDHSHGGRQPLYMSCKKQNLWTTSASEPILFQVWLCSWTLSIYQNLKKLMIYFSRYVLIHFWMLHSTNCILFCHPSIICTSYSFQLLEVWCLSQVTFGTLNWSPTDCRPTETDNRSCSHSDLRPIWS